MNYIKDINSFITEAISLKMYKENLPRDKYGRVDLSKDGWYPTYKLLWDDLFGVGVNRISIPLNKSKITLPETTPLMEEINSIFVSVGYKINSFEDYLNNKVYKISDTKNPMKIGKLLSKINEELFEKYDTDTERKEWKDKIENSNKGLKIVISRHPYDLLGMSSGRDWTSCMKLGTIKDEVYREIMCKVTGRDNSGWEEEGKFKDKIQEDIKNGVLIAYVVDIDDNNINNPKARLLIKPYIEDTYYGKYNPPVWYPSTKIYGSYVENFRDSVGAWLDSWQPKKYGEFVLTKGLYADGEENIIIPKPIGEWDKYQIDKFMNAVIVGRKKEWWYDEDGRVCVNGNVEISSENKKFEKEFIDKYPSGYFKNLPVKFGTVSGSFSIFKNWVIEDLSGLPIECKHFIGGVLNRGSNTIINRMVDLKSLPIKRINKGDFWLGSANRLTSLEGLPIGIKDLTIADSYNLKDLKYLSEIFGETFNGNIILRDLSNLTSLEGLPKKINGSLTLGRLEALENLDHLPKYIKKHLQLSGGSLKKYTKEDILEIVKLGSSDSIFRFDNY